MVTTYSAYLGRFVLKKPPKECPIPGEHHFVAAYLLPRLFQISECVPDYINPDGTKKIVGDVVYYRDGKHHFGIEVKLGTIRLTKNEFNRWIVSTNSREWPDIFMGVAHNGIILSNWAEFRSRYLASIVGASSRPPRAIKKGYGPTRSVSAFARFMPESWFSISNPTEADVDEERFVSALSSFMSGLTNRSSARVGDQLPSLNRRARGAQLNR